MSVHRWLLRLVSRLVPRDLRDEWLDEWTAEVAYRERQRAQWRSARRAPWDLLRRASGAFWDALWLRSSRWYSLRLFGREWRLALTAVLSLATAIAAVVIGLAAYDAFLFAPPGIRNASALRMIHISSRSDAFDTVSFPAYRDYRLATNTFDDVAAFPTSIAGNTLKKDRTTFQVWTAEVSDNFFSVLGATAERGQLAVHGPSAGGIGSGDAVISDALWRRLGADDAIVGRTLELNGALVRVAGVAARPFHGMSWGFAPDVWIAFATTDVMSGTAGRLEQPGHWLHLVGRLRPGVREEQATADAEKLASITDREPGHAPVVHRAVLSPISVTPPDERRWMSTILGGLMLIVALTLVVACANVTNLLLGLAVSRRHEMVVRAALGASRLQLALPLVREGAMLGLAAGVVGCLAAWSGLRKLATLGLSFTWFMPAFSLDIRPGAWVWVLSLAIALAAGAAASTMPALRSAAEGAEGLIRRESASAPRHARLRRALVGVQMVVCTVVLATLGLAAHSFFRLSHLPLGFQARDLAYADIDIDATGFKEASGPAFYRRLEEWMSSLPGTSAVALANASPLNGVPGNSQRVGTDRPGASDAMVPSIVVDDAYFATVEMPMIAGRRFGSRDRAGSAAVAIVNETMARRTWPDRNPVGRYLYLGDHRQPAEVIGVVPDSKYGDLDEPPMSMLYLPLAQHYVPEITVIARTSATRFAVQEHLSKLTPAPVLESGGIFTLDDMLRLSLALPRAIVWTTVVLGAVSFGLTLFALYSTVFYSVSQRRAEIGIRTALGATPTQLFTLVLSESAGVAAVGAGLGLLAAALLTPLAASIFVGIDGTDPLVLAAVAIICAATTVLIALIVIRPWTRLPATQLLRS